MKSKSPNIDKEIKDYLKENPSIKQALDIFNISSKAYSQCLQASFSPKKVISTKSTTVNG